MGKSGFIVRVAEWIVYWLPWATWAAVPIFAVIILSRAYYDSADYRAILEEELEAAEKSPKGFLDHMVDGEQAVAGIVKSLGGLNKTLTLSTKAFNASRLKLEKARTVKGQLRIASRLAKSINRESKRASRIAITLKRDRQLFSESYMGYFNWVEAPTTPEGRKKIMGERKAIAEARKAAKLLMRALDSVEDSKKEVRLASRDLHRSLDAHSKEMGTIRQEVGRVEDTCIKLIRVIDPKLAGTS